MTVSTKLLLMMGGTVALIVAAIVFIDNVHDRAFKAGQAAQAERYRERVAENDARNRALEDAFEASLAKVIETLDTKLEALDRRTNTRIETVREIITANPQLDECRIPPEIIDQKNALREEGVQ